MATVWDHIVLASKTPGITRIYLEGPPGTGKSFWALKHLGGAGTVAQTTLNEDVSVQELMGHYLPQGGEFKWHHGPFTLSFQEGKPLVINEISRASQAVQDCLLGVLDDPEIAAMTLPSGETIRPGSGFRVFSTSNSPFEELPEALRDRFDANFVITHPHPDLIAHLESLIKGLGAAIFNSYNDPKKAVSPRRAIAFAKYKKTMKADPAAALAFGKAGPTFLSALRASGVVIA